MSMHKIPLTQIEEEGLRSHGFAIGTPSQLSDAFRLGVAAGQAAERSRCKQLAISCTVMYADQASRDVCTYVSMQIGAA